MKLFYSYPAKFSGVVILMLLLFGCTITHSTKSIELHTGSPLSSISPKIFVFKEFKDERGTSPNFLYRLGSSDHVLNQPVSKMISSEIQKELERNGHKCVDNLHELKPDFEVEGTVIKYGIQAIKQFFVVKVIGYSEVKLTISYVADDTRIYSKVYQGVYQLSGSAVNLSDVLEEALPEMLREFSTDVDLVEFISRR